MLMLIIMPSEKQSPDPNQNQLLRQADQVIISAMGQEAVAGAERFLETQHAATWAQAHEQPEDFAPDQLNAALSDHPGQTPLAYHMSKAIGDEERQAVSDAYIRDPASVTLPDHL
jgi:hypothetical protein